MSQLAKEQVALSFCRYGSDVLLKSTSYPRPLCLSLAHLIMTLGCLALAAGCKFSTSRPFLFFFSLLDPGNNEKNEFSHRRVSLEREMLLVFCNCGRLSL